MNSEGEADEFWRDVAVTRPRLDDLLLLFLDHFHDLLQELWINVWAFFERACHRRLESSCRENTSDSDEGDDDLVHGG